MIPLLLLTCLAGLGVLFSFSCFFLISKFIYPWIIVPILLVFILIIITPYLLAFSPFIFIFLIGFLCLLSLFIFITMSFGVKISFDI